MAFLESATAGTVGSQRPRVIVSARWCAFSLRSLLLAIFVAAVASLYLRVTLDRCVEEHAAVSALQSAGAKIQMAPAEPHWLWSTFPHSISSQFTHAVSATLGEGRHTQGDVVLTHLHHLAMLESLTLVDSRVADEHTAALRNLRHLRHLDLSGCTSLSNQCLQNLPAAAQLRSLALASLRIDSDGMPLISRFTSLQSLFLEQTAIDDRGMISLSRLRSLQFLRLPPTVTSSGLKHIAHSPTLSDLSIHVERFHPNDALSVLTTLIALQHLSVYCDDLGDSDLLYVARIPSLSNLELHGGAFSEEGLLALKTASRLRSVRLDLTSVHAVTVEQLKESLSPIRVSTSRRRNRDERSARRNSGVALPPHSVTRSYP